MPLKRNGNKSQKITASACLSKTEAKMLHADNSFIFASKSKAKISGTTFFDKWFYNSFKRNVARFVFASFLFTIYPLYACASDEPQNGGGNYLSVFFLYGMFRGCIPMIGRDL